MPDLSAVATLNYGRIPIMPPVSVISRLVGAENAKLSESASAVVADAGYGPGTGTLVLTWNADPDPAVTDYRVELGSASGLSDRGTYLVGSTTALGYEVTVLTGNYYVRVRSMVGATPGTASDEQVVRI